MARGALPYAIASGAAFAVCACAAALPRPSYTPQPTSALVETRFPPPPARAEYIPAQPAKGAVWIDGEWTWRGRKWGWTAGRWVIPPEGASFSPWTTVRASDGTLFYAQGTWRDVEGQALPHPAPLALGTTGYTAATTEATGPSATELAGAAPEHEDADAGAPERATDGGAPERATDGGAPEPRATDGGAPPDGGT